ncbi:hypothetical protein TBLA_0C07250 [Henningerozyma blattae CBS 6284]|uniref:Glycosyltransferase family 91 protein n=1 Tax=Henningerozyma blattae (strain ATCC 34711 / CBS 6284 / DSM 70876 / NBRC 10599 / NRRL Y-10934 / UCD 77-7) TaxID=1071380 RepID=I2H2B4_HENB6|nr:hypothetical protein TBLA_0C07250 [Tetrapisispora blattae CBS 6284]CCH60516.1 hypothetical protein TBLA_0C07250 [Tetrapisispora blattae CBS 6284]
MSLIQEQGDDRENISLDTLMQTTCTGENKSIDNSLEANGTGVDQGICSNIFQLKLQNLKSSSRYVAHILRSRCNFRFLMNSKLKLRMVILLSLIVILSSFHILSGSSIKNTTYFFSSNNRLKPVTSKKDLLSSDFSSILKVKSFKNRPINNIMRNRKFEEYSFNSYLTNLDPDFLIDNHSKKFQNLAEGEKKDIEKKLDCDSLKYSSKISYSSDRTIISDDIISIRKQLLDANDEFSRAIVATDEKDKELDEIIKKRWFQFGASSVWLESEQCYLTISRILYTPKEDKSQPKISFLRAQTFDRNWNELTGKRIAKIDVVAPANIEKELKKIDDEYGLSNGCESIVSDPNVYEKCISKQNNQRLEAQERKNLLLDKYFVTYPTIYKIPFDTDGKFRGPEDPRIILRKIHNNEEPVIIFNMGNEEGRGIHTFLPHRAIEQLQKLKVSNFKVLKKEKNWTPFFTEDDIPASILLRGFIHFVYSFSPFQILKCSLDDGYCDMITGVNSEKFKSFHAIRGASQFVPLPEPIPQVRDTQIWLGFPKTHSSGCGCGSHFYRPLMMLMIEHNGLFHQEFIAPNINFNVNVQSWDHGDARCDWNNVMTPNSIAAWDIVEHDHKSNKIEDYLVLTYSEADEVSKVVIIRGLVNHILQMYHKKDVSEKYTPSPFTRNMMKKTVSCAINQLRDDCAKYAEIHNL